MLHSAESRKEDRAKQVERKKLFSPTNSTEHNEFRGSINITGNKRFLPLNETETKPFVFPDCSEDHELEVYIGMVWEEIAQNHVPKMLEDLESLKYVPVQIRKKMASEPLFLDRSE